VPAPARSTRSYSAGLAACTVVAIALEEVLRLVLTWGYRDGRSYLSLAISDSMEIVLLFVAILAFVAGNIAFRVTVRARPALRTVLLTVLVPVLLFSATVLLLGLANVLQGRINGMASGWPLLVVLVPRILAVALAHFGLPCLLATAVWSAFFCLYRKPAQ
jgi:hypothetical protein